MFLQPKAYVEANCFLKSLVQIPLKSWWFISYDCCGLCRKWPLRRANHLFRGVLPCVFACVHVCVF